MAIFSRRSLQRLLNENSEFLTIKQTKDHVRRLNSNDLSVEWEVALLNVFAKLGTVLHERNFNGKRPDLYFASQDKVIEFLADIKTVSDLGLDTKNPFGPLQERLNREVFSRGIKGMWRIDVGGNYEEARRDGKMVQMKLPALARFDKEIFNENFDEFARLIKDDPSEGRVYRVNTTSTDLTLSYSPSNSWEGIGSHPGYKAITRREHLIQNSLYSGLETKADQLKSTLFDGSLGIIVCDGGSDFLKRGKSMIDEFLQNHPEIVFVVAVWVDQRFGYAAANRILIDAVIRDNVDSALRGFLEYFCDYGPEMFPYPIRDARNASIVAKSPNPEKMGSFIGGCTIGYSHIKLSSRSVLDLLAGKRSYDNFPETYRKFFAKHAGEGRIFESISVERSENEEDDDWLVIEFSDPDPAVSPFKEPPRDGTD